MRHCLGTGVVLAVAVLAAHRAAAAEDGLRPVSLVHRYGLEVDLEHFPQGDPQQTIRSVIRATKSGRVDYMLAHLISPSQVDAKFRGDVEAMKKAAAKATPQKSAKMIAALERQLAEGTWTIRRDRAWSRVDGLPALSLEKIGDHWFMHNTPVAQPAAKNQ